MEIRSKRTFKHEIIGKQLTETSIKGELRINRVRINRAQSVQKNVTCNHTFKNKKSPPTAICGGAFH